MIVVLNALKRVGLSPTRTRVAVLEFFHEHPDDHLTADQVYRQLVPPEHSQPYSLASIYRALGNLHDTGLLQVSPLGEGRTVYELSDGRSHHHLVCRQCGCVVDAPCPTLPGELKGIAAQHGFVFGFANLVMFGHCAACAAARKHD